MCQSRFLAGIGQPDETPVLSGAASVNPRGGEQKFGLSGIGQAVIATPSLALTVEPVGRHQPRHRRAHQTLADADAGTALDQIAYPQMPAARFHHIAVNGYNETARLEPDRFDYAVDQVAGHKTNSLFYKKTLTIYSNHEY